MRKKNPKQTKQILKSYRTQAEVLATVIYNLYRTISTVPDMRSQWGFQQFYPERVIQLSRPDGRSYWTLRKRDWNFPDSYLVPYTSLQDGSLACNGASLGQNRSRTSLQDRDPACKRNLWDALRCKIGIPRAKLFESNVRHPWKGSGPLLTKNLTGRRLRHSC